MIVITAARGGMFRETVAMSKAYGEARTEHGDSELLDEIVAAKPHVDHTRYHSAEELRDNGLKHLRDAVALVDSKATAQEGDDYRRFVLTAWPARWPPPIRRQGKASVPRRPKPSSKSPRPSARPAPDLDPQHKQTTGNLVDLVQSEASAYLSAHRPTA